MDGTSYKQIHVSDGIVALIYLSCKVEIKRLVSYLFKLLNNDFILFLLSTNPKKI